MKITIFVNKRDLENLHSFIEGVGNETIEWYSERPIMGIYTMVTMTYGNFVRLTDK